jgi:hypothetical protein
MPANDTLCDRQSETRSLAYGAGGKKGIENPSYNFRINAASMILDLNADLIIGACRTQAKLSAIWH